MQNPNADTEWNDILRQRGILPPKPPAIEEDPSSPDPEGIMDNLTSDKLVEKYDLMDASKNDEESTNFLEEYRRKRIAMMRQEAMRPRFGQVREVSKSDWKREVTDAGDVYVVIHITGRGHPLCTLIDQHLRKLAENFPLVKFLRGEADLCIPNYPFENLPSLLVYRSGNLEAQLIGPSAVGGSSVTSKDLEWQLSRLNVLKSKLIEEPSKKQIKVLTARSKQFSRLGAQFDEVETYGSDEDS